jgi:hypothetical protein
MEASTQISKEILGHQATSPEKTMCEAEDANGHPRELKMPGAWNICQGEPQVRGEPAL